MRLALPFVLAPEDDEFDNIYLRNQGANDLDWPPHSSRVDLRNTRSIGDLNTAEVMALNLTAGQVHHIFLYRSLLIAL